MSVAALIVAAGRGSRLKGNIAKQYLALNNNTILRETVKNFTEHPQVDYVTVVINRKDLNLYKKLDIALDTFPYNGVTTTFEALWMGVPIIGIKGYNFNSRCGESILKNASLNSFIASDKQNYVDKALYFSENINLLEKERNKLFDQVLYSPIFNSKKFKYCS